MKNIILLALLFSTLLARSNPFEPVVNTQNPSDYRAMPPKQIEKEEILLPPSSRIIKSITITHQEVDGTTSKIDKKIEKTVDWHAPIEISQPSSQKLTRNKNYYMPIEELDELKEISFFVQDDTLKIETKSELRGDMFLPNPSRIILDFNSSTPFASQTSQLSGGYFTTISVSFHGTFYRVEITLDSYYPYKIERIKDGFLLGLN